MGMKVKKTVAEIMKMYKDNQRLGIGGASGRKKGNDTGAASASGEGKPSVRSILESIKTKNSVNNGSSSSSNKPPSKANEILERIRSKNKNASSSSSSGIAATNQLAGSLHSLPPLKRIEEEDKFISSTSAVGSNASPFEKMEIRHRLKPDERMVEEEEQSLLGTSLSASTSKGNVPPSSHRYDSDRNKKTASMRIEKGDLEGDDDEEDAPLLNR
jgi:hypothetical protein